MPTTAEQSDVIDWSQQLQTPVAMGSQSATTTTVSLVAVPLESATQVAAASSGGGDGHLVQPRVQFVFNGQTPADQAPVIAVPQRVSVTSS